MLKKEGLGEIVDGVGNWTFVTSNSFHLLNTFHFLFLDGG